MWTAWSYFLSSIQYCLSIPSKWHAMGRCCIIPGWAWPINKVQLNAIGDHTCWEVWAKLHTQTMEQDQLMRSGIDSNIFCTKFWEQNNTPTTYQQHTNNIPTTYQQTSMLCSLRNQELVQLLWPPNCIFYIAQQSPPAGHSSTAITRFGIGWNTFCVRWVTLHTQ